MGKHPVLRHLARRHQDVNPTPIPPIPRRNQDYKVLLGHGGRVCVLWNCWHLHDDILLRPSVRILEPIAHRQVYQQRGPLAQPFGNEYRDRRDHLSYPSPHGPATE